MNDLNRLRDALERGLGLHHDIEGECAVRITDADLPSTSLFLSPGSVTLGPRVHLAAPRASTPRS